MHVHRTDNGSKPEHEGDVGDVRAEDAADGEVARTLDAGNEAHDELRRGDAEGDHRGPHEQGRQAEGHRQQGGGPHEQPRPQQQYGEAGNSQDDVEKHAVRVPPGGGGGQWGLPADSVPRVQLWLAATSQQVRRGKEPAQSRTRLIFGVAEGLAAVAL